MPATLRRTAFQTSRLLDFLSRKELVAQIGHPPSAWPLVALKELVDNAIDACEEAGVPPEIEIVVCNRGIRVSDNGPGIPAEVVANILDFSSRTSSREAYVAPDRGAQGNALKTLLAMPFVLDGQAGEVEITAQSRRHRVTIRVDRIRQQPVLDHDQEASESLLGRTDVFLRWSDSTSQLDDDLEDLEVWDVQEDDASGSLLAEAKSRFLQMAENFTFLDPHLALVIDWHGQRREFASTDPAWRKWLPSMPTSSHWYRPEHFERLVAGYIAHDADQGRDRTVRELVAEFNGLTSTAKQKQVLDETGLARTNLSALASNGHLDSARLGNLLNAMHRHSKPVQPARLGFIGRAHLHEKLHRLGCEMESFQYKKLLGETDGVPWILETAFAWCPEAVGRRIVTGVNWSPGILNLFRELGKWGRSLDSILEQQRAGSVEPVVLVLHLACPRVEYTDRGKSAVVIA